MFDLVRRSRSSLRRLAAEPRAVPPALTPKYVSNARLRRTMPSPSGFAGFAREVAVRALEVLLDRVRARVEDLEAEPLPVTRYRNDATGSTADAGCATDQRPRASAGIRATTHRAGVSTIGASRSENFIRGHLGARLRNETPGAAFKSPRELSPCATSDRASGPARRLNCVPRRMRRVVLLDPRLGNSDATRPASTRVSTRWTRRPRPIAAAMAARPRCVRIARPPDLHRRVPARRPWRRGQCWLTGDFIPWGADPERGAIALTRDTDGGWTGPTCSRRARTSTSSSSTERCTSPIPTTRTSSTTASGTQQPLHLHAVAG